jgi:hypothetical protein
MEAAGSSKTFVLSRKFHSVTSQKTLVLAFILVLGWVFVLSRKFHSVTSQKVLVLVLFFFSSWGVWDWVHSVRRPLIGLLYQPRIIDDDECGAVGGISIGRGSRSTRRKPAPVPLCIPQIPHDLSWARTRAAAMGSMRLTAWAMARPSRHVKLNYFLYRYKIICF